MNVWCAVSILAIVNLVFVDHLHQCGELKGEHSVVLSYFNIKHAKLFISLQMEHLAPVNVVKVGIYGQLLGCIELVYIVNC